MEKQKFQSLRKGEVLSDMNLIKDCMREIDMFQSLRKGEVLSDELGLEPDYIEDLCFNP